MAISRDFKPMKLHGHMKSRMHVIAIFWDIGYIYIVVVIFLVTLLVIFRIFWAFFKYHAWQGRW
jgi:hypothetical protein